MQRHYEDKTNQDILLCTYANGWQFLTERRGAKIISTCDHLIVQFASIQDTCNRADSILRALPKLKKITFLRNNVQRFDQCWLLRQFLCEKESREKQLTDDATCVQEITILPSGNPITDLALWREFVAYTLPSLRTLNGDCVNEVKVPHTECK